MLTAGQVLTLRQRGGFGLVLGLALFFLLVAGVIALALGQRGTGVTAEVRAAAQVARARQAATAALEELAFVVAARANAPGDPLGSSLRTTALTAGGAPVPLPVGIGDLAGYLALVAPAYEGVTLTGASATVIGGRVFRTSSLPFHGEHYGTLELTAEVTIARRGAPASRISAQRWLEFKVLCPTVPPPFDRMRLAMQDPGGWCTAHAVYDKDQPALTDVNRLLDRILLDFDEARLKIRELRENDKKIPAIGVGADFKREIKEGTAEVERMLAGAAALETYWRSGPPVVDLRYFFAPQLRYVLKGDVDGVTLNLPQVLNDLAPRRLVESRALDATRRELEAQINRGAYDAALPTGQRSRRETKVQLTTDIQLLTELKRIQEAFTLRVGQTEINRTFGPHLALLSDGADNSYARDGSTLAVSAGRLTHAVSEPGVKANLTALARAYGGKLSGLVVVRNPTEELALTAADAADLAAPGTRLTLVVRGNLDVDALAVPPGAGVLTLIGHGRVRARGDLGAALMALGSLEPTGPLTVRGHLFLRDNGTFSGATPEDVMQRIKVIEDPRFWSWDPAKGEQVDPRSLQVFIGPRVIHETAVQQAVGG